LPTALAVGGTVVALRRARLGGALLALSVFAKLWTGALVPLLWARRQLNAFTAAMVTLAIGGAGWVWWSGGLGGVQQVATFRGAHGWHAESGPGVLLELLTGGTLHMESGSWRLGAPPRLVTGALALVLVVALVALWARARRSPRGAAAGLAEAAAVSAVLVFSPLLSPQFLIWLVPWLALAGAAKERTVERFGWVAVALTVFVVAVSDPSHVDAVWLQLVLLARNGALLGVFVAGFRRLASARPAPTDFSLVGAS
jgi:hypothetical protein